MTNKFHCFLHVTEFKVPADKHAHVTKKLNVCVIHPREQNQGSIVFQHMTEFEVPFCHTKHDVFATRAITAVGYATVRLALSFPWPGLGRKTENCLFSTFYFDIEKRDTQLMELG